MQIDKNKILATSVDHILSRVNKTYHERIKRVTGQHYRFLIYMSWQFSNARFLDLGTRGGMSAICLADNPSNNVISVDITDHYRKENISDFSSYKNIKFVISKAEEFPIPFYKDFDLILIDLDHSGRSEGKILRKLQESKFSGILVLDDINFKYKQLKAIWSNISKPKRLLEYAHHSGTGVVSFGTEILYVD